MQWTDIKIICDKKFEDVRCEMDYIRGKSNYNGKVSIKKFIDGLMLEADRY